MKFRRATTRDLASLIRIDEVARADAARCVELRDAIDAGELHVAESESGVLGFVAVDRSFFGRAFVRLICVAAEARRRGVGTFLLARVAERTRDEDLFTSTNESNVAAQRLFAAVGFEPSGRIEGLDPGDAELVYARQAERG